MDKKSKSILFFISFGVALYAALMNLSVVWMFLQETLGLVFPILLGLILAFILSVPMKGFENLLTRILTQCKLQVKAGLIRGLSLVLTLFCIILVIALAFTTAIPAITDSIKSILPLITEKWPEWVSYLSSYNINLSQLSALFQASDWEKLSNGANMFLNSAVSAAASTVSVATNVTFAVVIAIYVLLSKNVLTAQIQKLMRAHWKEATVTKICYVSSLIRDTYGKFLSGQCMEAIILGALIFVSYSIFRLPYAALVAFLTSIFAFIPYIGALAACCIGAFLILLAEPSKVILCIIVYLTVQFIENQFIYPHVVGTSVGLSPLWTLIAALLGGKLFGLAGIIFFIPLVAVLYSLVREDTNNKLQHREAIRKKS